MIEFEEEVPGILALQLYDRESCHSIIEYAKKSDGWTEAGVGIRAGKSQHGAAIRPESRLASGLSLPSKSEVRLEFDQKVNDVIKPVVKRVWRVALTQHSDTHIVRYSQGNYYKAHSDTGFNLNDRYFTVLCYLNENFGGGETKFPDINYSVRPRSGRVIIFPSPYIHCAEPVTSGEKYIIVCWITGPLPTQWI